MSDLLYAGTASAPSAGGVVAESGALNAGRYVVGVVAYLEGSGTPAVGTDDNNIALYSGITEVGPLALPATKTLVASTYPVVVDVAGGDKISVQAVADATSSVVYAASLVVHEQAGF